MDKTDIRILELIQKDARISIVELAGQVNLTQTPCARRIQNLEKKGLIKDYVGLIDQSKIGLKVNAFVELRLIRGQANVIEDFETRISSYSEIMECYALSGGHDYLLRVVSPDLEAYHKFLKEKLLAIEAVDGVQTSFALNRVIYRTTLPLDGVVSIVT